MLSIYGFESIYIWNFHFVTPFGFQVLSASALSQVTFTSIHLQCNQTRSTLMSRHAETRRLAKLRVCELKHDVQCLDMTHFTWKVKNLVWRKIHEKIVIFSLSVFGICTWSIVSFKIMLKPTENEPIWRGASLASANICFLLVSVYDDISSPKCLSMSTFDKMHIERARAQRKIYEITHYSRVYRRAFIFGWCRLQNTRFGFSMVGPLIPIGAIAFKYSFVLLFLFWERNVKWSIYFDVDTFINGTLFVLCS